MEKCHMSNNSISKINSSTTARINRIIGQLNGIQKMIDEGRYCIDVLIQLEAINKSVKSLSSVILNNHLHTCVNDKILEGNNEVLDELSDLFKKYI